MELRSPYPSNIFPTNLVIRQIKIGYMALCQYVPLKNEIHL